MPGMSHTAQSNLPVGVERPLYPDEAKALPDLQRAELVSVGIEAPHRFGCQSGTQFRVHQLTTELKISAKPKVELLAELSQVKRGACLQREIKEPAINRAHPHSTTQLVIVGEPESRYPPGASPNRHMKGNRVPGSRWVQPDGPIRLHPGVLLHSIPQQLRI